MYPTATRDEEEEEHEDEGGITDAGASVKVSQVVLLFAAYCLLSLV